MFNGTAAELTTWISSFQPSVEVEVQSGQLNTGANALTVIAVPPGSGSKVAFGCDNGVQGLAPAVLRVAIFDTQWHVTNGVTVDSTKGMTAVQFPDAGKTGVISVIRHDAGEVIVGIRGFVTSGASGLVEDQEEFEQAVILRGHEAPKLGFWML